VSRSGRSARAISTTFSAAVERCLFSPQRRPLRGFAYATRRRPQSSSYPQGAFSDLLQPDTPAAGTKCRNGLHIRPARDHETAAISHWHDGCVVSTIVRLADLCRHIRPIDRPPTRSSPDRRSFRFGGTTRSIKNCHFIVSALIVVYSA
jgi:hypothetical protein